MKQPHIALDESLGISYAILPGDPARIDRIAGLLEQPKALAHNREFRSLRGKYRGIDVLALSTGIGGCSAGIALEELHGIGIRAVIRVGSCGALQSGIALGDLILASGAVRDDGASKAYLPGIYPAFADIELLSCALKAARTLGIRHHEGVIHSHESFYHDEADQQSAFWASRGILGADMETAALMTIGRLRGIKVASILNNVVLYGADTANAIGAYADGAERTARGELDAIRVALESFAQLDVQKRGTEK